MRRESSALRATIYLLGWYGGNTVFNVVNKQVMSGEFGRYHWMVSWLQLVAGLCWILPSWLSGMRPAPLVDREFLLSKFGPISCLHATGHAAQVSAMGSGTVFAVAVVKASEPVVGTIISVATGSFPSRYTNASLIPIVAGVALASMKPGSGGGSLLNHASLAAFASTVLFAIAKLLAKRLMTPQIKSERRIDPANNYALLTTLSCLLLVLPALCLDGPAALETFGDMDRQSRKVLALRILLSGLAYYTSNECSFQILDLLGPVPQAVANAAKRVFVFVAAVLFLGEKVTPLKLAGSTLALFGVLCYSLSKTMSDKAQKTKKK